MKIGVVADDFTGASDIALTLAEAGMRTMQYIGVPDSAPGGDVEAGVVALKSRTAPVGDAVAQSLAAARWLRRAGAEQIILKVCSTFDSTADGNIGPVLDALAAELDTPCALVCPAFPENGRSVYQGHLFVGDRLLNESGMQDHPLTPMKDPDLRRVLAEQSAHPVGHVPLSVVRGGKRGFKAVMKTGGFLIVDAIGDADLMRIGEAAKGQVLLCGGSGIALGLPANFGAKPAAPDWTPVQGPGVVLSGSCSRATRGQVETYLKEHPGREVLPHYAVEGRIDIPSFVRWVQEQDVPPLIYSSADPEDVRKAQQALGKERVAEAIEGVFSDLARALVDAGVRRVVVAGGETSGAVVTGLQAQDLTIGPRVAAGVPLVSTRGIAIALKSGNFGGPDFFKKALDLMARRPA